MTIAVINGLEIVRLGDKTTHGGEVITASANFTYEGIPVARVGDMVRCPKCKGTFPITSGSPNAFNGQQIAKHNDEVACGARLIARSGTLKPSAVTQKSKAKTALFVDVKNQDERFDEFLPFTVSVVPGMPDKALSGQKALVGEFEEGTYTVSITPVPPAGEELGPVPISDNPKFERKITLNGKEEHISITITRRESIEHNIMMTFLVEPRTGTPPTTAPFYELAAHNTFSLTRAYVNTYAAHFSLEPDMVHAIQYMEETHGYYDAFIPKDKIKSILPMNVNIVYWEKMFTAKGITRNDLFDRETNTREGCFLLHRLHVRAKPQNLLEVATLYNSSSAKFVLDYGFHVQRIHANRLWLRQPIQPSSFD